ncbi:DEAD-domain-containing protein [Dendrothele bispora CBS 962.96]|uniref:DEAD-domain-containing protein n=1 Tax=Dendrothele bispora (strain CBS 962.96) TaxID=1314807 RepID=A0A4S8MYS5_DENBC|nr:DEAD-domain-containing protein [Dendrothele bispora CBS 962.96]
MGKRKTLTSDDLLRRQERSDFKRIKLTSIPRQEFSDDDSQSESESSTSSRLHKPAVQFEDEDGDDSDNSESSSGNEESRLEVKERVAFGSRVPTRTQTTQVEKSVPVEKLPSTFSKLGISSPLQGALKMMSIHTPTEVQAACIPPLLNGRDCIGNAKTGSGKTIAFALPILQKLSMDPYGIFALILTPTRELAFQISEQFAVLGSSMNIRTAVVVGGMDMMAQALELENRPHVVVATPGRMIDHLKTGNGQWNLSRIKFLVLDEADRLLSSTFASDLAYLFSILPKDRQTCLFTATITPSIDALANATPRPGKEKPFIHRMKEIVETVETLKQSYLLVPSHVREMYLFHLLANPPGEIAHLRRAPPEPAKKANKVKSKSKEAAEDDIQQPPPTIVFCKKPRTAAYLTLLLKTLSIRSTALHSRLTQRERLSSLSLFRSSVIPVLISTDVGARGLDIDDVALVINWDLPDEAEEYTHRVGRTARAGRGGMAISFVTEKDEERVLRIEDRIKTKLEEMELPESRVLEKINTVSTAKRLANMELHDSEFGKREKVQKLKESRG